VTLSGAEASEDDARMSSTFLSKILKEVGRRDVGIHRQATSTHEFVDGLPHLSRLVALLGDER